MEEEAGGGGEADMATLGAARDIGQRNEIQERGFGTLSRTSQAVPATTGSVTQSAGKAVSRQS